MLETQATPLEEQGWAEAFKAYISLFASLFARSESRGKAEAYLRGLFSELPRKNCWHLAEWLGFKSPLPLQRLLNDDPWSDAAMMKSARAYVKTIIEEAAESNEGIAVVDESGFVKKGEKSAGVQRQYCGRLGKVENCQVGVFLALVTPTLQTFLDRRLYLPKAWCEDEQRAAAAQIPPGTVFKTKPQLALAMLEQAWDEGLELPWVTADSSYGNSPDFRQGIAGREQLYVLEIARQHQLRYRGKLWSLKTLPKLLAETQWQVETQRAGEQGLIEESWAFLRVTLKREQEEQWLILRRNEAGDIDLYLSNAPEDTAFGQLITVVMARHGVERGFQEAKSELGLADYEVRYYHAWYRHITLCLVAHLFLARQRQLERKKNRCCHCG